jgi:penicillin-binding protein, 1A family
MHLPKKARLVRFLMHPAGKFLVGFATFLLVLGAGFFTYLYVHYSKLIDAKLKAGPYANTSKLYAAPSVIMIGDEASPEEIVAQLRRSGYGESRSNRMGWYNVRADQAVEIFPGPDSFAPREDAVIKFSEGRVSEIISLRDHTPRTQYFLEPELISNLFDRNREKRRLVRFEDIPKVLVDAVTSAEDKRFFHHQGFDPLRIIASAYQDIRKGYRFAGASTLTMQLSRMFWLTPEKTIKRKALELLITLHLERKLTKKEIFEYYANQIDLGRHRSFSIHGFGEGAQVYFGKDIRHLTLPEAALLAGLIQRPNYLNPYRHPERAKARRNIVLGLMRENKLITDREYEMAIQAPVELAKGGVESTDAPYFVDLVNDELQENFADHDFQAKSYRVYTTLDMNLQREAVEAVRIGMKEVDDQLRARRKDKTLPVEPQVALVALDPQTGEVKALIGGRNYGVSQLNRTRSMRQPGSIFKPFVYAAALATAVEETPSAVLTPISTFTDEPTTFWYHNRPYEPNNYKSQFFGLVTMRQALTKSLNIPTVKTAEAVGYEKVANFARSVGLNAEPTPAVALGAYDNTPLDMAGAYTVFANMGVYSAPNWIRAIRDEQGNPLYDAKPVRKQLLDPRVAYLMVNMLEDVMRTGTGAGARSRGFLLPAAGKTGTSRDGWFAGFTTKLLCVVYVGFDDGKELKLEGARAALPIWTEFMKRAHKYRQYRAVSQFSPPEGVVTVDIDPATGLLASVGCPSVRSEVFIAGTQPIEVCHFHGGVRTATHVASWDTSSNDGVAAPAAAQPNSIVLESKPVAKSVPPAPQKAELPVGVKERPKEKKGFFGRLKDLFR